MRNPLLIKTETGAHETVAVALSSIRKHLGMEVAYISEFDGNNSVFREVDAPGLEALIKVGDIRSLDDVYCRQILDGRLPELMADTADYELASSMPITAAVPIGAHMSVPIRGKDGAALGMFCCFSPNPNKSLNERDLQVMRVFADMAANQISDQMDVDRNAAEKRARVEAICAHESFSLVYQPIWEFNPPRATGFEVLCRFAPQPYRSPDKWFRDAFDSGCGAALEMAVIRRAVQAFASLPGDIYLSVNTSPETVLSGAFATLEGSVPLDRLVLEITEHAAVEDYAALEEALAPLRQAGVRLAIDDAGAGYSSLQHIVRLRPDIVKLDMSLTRGIDADPARQALATALIFFGLKTDFIVIAEGVETAAELNTLKSLDVPRGQGYFLGKPVDLKDALNLLTDAARPADRTARQPA